MEPHPSSGHPGPNPATNRAPTGPPHWTDYILSSPSHSAPSSAVPQPVQDGWLTLPSPALTTNASEALHNSSFSPHLIASGGDPQVMAVTEGWGDQPACKGAADWAPTRDPSFNSSMAIPSLQQVVQMSYTRQQQIGTYQSHFFAEHTSLHPTANATVNPSDLENTLQVTGQGFWDQTPTHPPDWLQPFNDWLPTRQQQMMSVQGLGDPLLCRSVWIEVFGVWLQLHLLLSNRGEGDLANPPYYWINVFDRWFQRLFGPDAQGPDPSHTSASSAGPSAFQTSLPPTLHTPDTGASYTASPPRKGYKRIPNAVSRSTLQEIQKACRRNGADENTIARLAIVFPVVVSRDCLMLTGRPSTSAGDKRGHQGYMEFVGLSKVNPKDVKKRRGGTVGMNADQVQRYYCKLCGSGKLPRWKNSKDLLNHVWDTHCDPQGSGE